MIFFKKLKSKGLEPRCNTLSEPASSWQIVQSILSHLSDSPSTMCPIDTVSLAPVRRAIMQLCSGRFSALGQFWRRGCEVFSDVYCSLGHLYATTYCLQGVPSWPLLASVQKHSCLHNDHLHVFDIEFSGAIVFLGQVNMWIDVEQGTACDVWWGIANDASFSAVFGQALCLTRINLMGISG